MDASAGGSSAVGRCRRRCLLFVLRHRPKTAARKKKKKKKSHNHGCATKAQERASAFHHSPSNVDHTVVRRTAIGFQIRRFRSLAAAAADGRPSAKAQRGRATTSTKSGRRVGGGRDRGG